LCEIDLPPPVWARLGGELATSVYPFILRGVRLLGVDQTMPYDLEGYPDDPQRWDGWRAERQRMWALLSESLGDDAIGAVHAGTIGLAQLPEYAPKIIGGEVAGRLLVDVKA